MSSKFPRGGGGYDHLADSLIQGKCHETDEGRHPVWFIYFRLGCWCIWKLLVGCGVWLVPFWKKYDVRQKKKIFWFSSPATSIQKVPHIHFLHCNFFFQNTKYFVNHEYTWQLSFVIYLRFIFTKLQSRPQIYDILANVQRKSVYYNLFMLFEIEKMH